MQGVHGNALAIRPLGDREAVEYSESTGRDEDFRNPFIYSSAVEISWDTRNMKLDVD